MRGQRNWFVGVFVAGLLVWAQPAIMLQDEVRAVDAFKSSVGRYFTMLATKDPSIITFFEKIASENFRYQRGEMQYNKKAWLVYLHEYLIDDTVRIRYEYEVQSTESPHPDSLIIHLTAIEIRLWNDVNGIFGPANHILEYREPFEIDVVLVREKDEWRWQQVTFYGIGKREFEQPAK